MAKQDPIGLALKSKSPKTLDKLSGDKDADVRCNVARNPQTSAETLRKLSEDADEEVAKAVKNNPNYRKPEKKVMTVEERRQLAIKSTSPEELAKLSEDKDYIVRLKVANNPNTSVETLAKLSEDIYYVRWHVADNPHTSVETLAKLSGDADYCVRLKVARNPHTSIETLAKLSEYKGWYVRCCVASNPNTSAETLAKLSGDMDDDVRQAALNHPNYRPSNQETPMTKPSFTQTFQSDLVSASYRTAAHHISKSSRQLLLSVLREHGFKKKQLRAVTDLLETEYGQALVSLGIGWGLTHFPHLGEDERVQRLAEEFRVSGMSSGMNVAVGSLMEKFLPVVTGVMGQLQAPGERLRIAENKEEEDEDEEMGEVVEMKKKRK